MIPYYTTQQPPEPEDIPFPFTLDQVLADIKTELTENYSHLPSHPKLQELFETNIKQPLLQNPSSPYLIAADLFAMLDLFDNYLTQIDEFDPEQPTIIFNILSHAYMPEPQTLKEKELSLFKRDCLEKGSLLYHFSNGYHELGHKGHNNMYFTTNSDPYSVDSDNLDFSKPLFAHTYTVLDPSQIILHDLQAQCSNIDLVEGYISGEYPCNSWYISQKSGAVELIGHTCYYKGKERAITPAMILLGKQTLTRMKQELT